MLSSCSTPAASREQHAGLQCCKARGTGLLDRSSPEGHVVAHSLATPAAFHTCIATLVQSSTARSHDTHTHMYAISTHKHTLELLAASSWQEARGPSEQLQCDCRSPLAGSNTRPTTTTGAACQRPTQANHNQPLPVVPRRSLPSRPHTATQQSRHVALAANVQAREKSFEHTTVPVEPQSQLTAHTPLSVHIHTSHDMLNMKTCNV